MTDEERVRALLGEAFDVDPPASARPHAGSVKASHRRRAWQRGVTVAAVTAAVVALVAVPLSLRGGKTARPAALATTVLTTAATPTPSASATTGGIPPVLVDGDLVEASGRVAAVPGHPVRFCAPVAESDVGYLPGHEPAPTGCELGVDVRGVNLATLSQRREEAGAIEGWAYLRGTYRAGTLTVSVQSAPRTGSDVSAPRWDTPPCPQPAAGWAKISKNGNPDMSRVDRFTADHPGVVTNTVIFRPTPTSYVVVLTASQPDLVHTALGPNGPHLCVVASRFTAAQLKQAESDVIADQAEGVFESGGTSAEDGQLSEDVQAVMVTPALHALAAGLPAGLLNLHPWLTQVTADAPPPPALPSTQSLSSEPTGSATSSS